MTNSELFSRGRSTPQRTSQHITPNNLNRNPRGRHFYQDDASISTCSSSIHSTFSSSRLPQHLQRTLPPRSLTTSREYKVEKDITLSDVTHDTASISTAPLSSFSGCGSTNSSVVSSVSSSSLAPVSRMDFDSFSPQSSARQYAQQKQYPHQKLRTNRENPMVLSQNSQQNCHDDQSIFSDSRLAPKGYRRASSTASAPACGVGAAAYQRIINTAKEQKQRQEAVKPNSAAEFARSAPKAGYLHKLGANIHQYKRRFFVLKPTTHLYYFLSPNDASPRGCVDLEACEVKELGVLGDGRFRFEIFGVKEQKIVLESRNEEVGREWMESLKEERITYCKSTIERLRSEKHDLESRIGDLEKQIDNFCLVEKDRDGAIQDAFEWREKFYNLNEALRLLTKQIQRPPHIDEEDPKQQEGNKRESTSKLEETENEEEEGDISLLDKKSMSFATVSDEERQLDELDLSETHFSSLSNLCQMLCENARLTSIEANSAIEEVHASNEKFQCAQHKLVKAEKILCKLWEENCTLRDSVKHRKMEKKVLVKEIRSLMEKAKLFQNKQNANVPSCADSSFRSGSRLSCHSHNRSQQRTLPQSIEKKKIIDELEDQIMCSLRMHEKFLAANGRARGGSIAMQNDIVSTSDGQPCTHLNGTLDTSAAVASEYSDKGPDEAASPIRPRYLLIGNNNRTSDGCESTSDISSIHMPSYSDLVHRKSLYEESCDEESREGEYSHIPTHITNNKIEIRNDQIFSNSQESIYSPAELGGSNGTDLKNDIVDKANEEIFLQYGEYGSPQNHFHPPNSSYSYKNHKTLQLDDSLRVEEEEAPKNLWPSVSPMIDITKNGKATATLTCQFADVISTKNNKQISGQEEDGEMYHLTFYSKKIGLQFQKVPADSCSSGALTEAMKTDMKYAGDNGNTRGRGSTFTELKSIATISGSFNRESLEGHDEACQPVTPIDAVLVCGFTGFDDASNNERPKMGARLVAFDGISIEIGLWTFESVGKAIQARGRPLTLSFRNDYLTHKQRSILTKAVNQINADRPPLPKCNPQRFHSPSDETVPYKDYSPTASTSDLHHAERSPQKMYEHNIPLEEDSKGYFLDSSFSSYVSSSSHQNQRVDISSFSDTGSSSILTSAIGPLVANFMSGLSQNEARSESYIPKYLRGGSGSLNRIPYHQDFKAGLL